MTCCMATEAYNVCHHNKFHPLFHWECGHIFKNSSLIVLFSLFHLTNFIVIVVFVVIASIKTDDDYAEENKGKQFFVYSLSLGSKT